MLDASGEEAAGLHHLVSGVVDGGGGVIDRADNRELIRVLGHAREDLRYLHPRNVGLNRPERAADLFRRIRLHVPGIELTRRAQEEEHDAVNVFVFACRPLILKTDVFRKGEAEHGERAGMEKVPAGHSITEAYRLL